jgi:phenylacetate-CoA ligase
LIRYALGDIGIPSDRTCPCGRTWPLIAAIEGRALDFLTMPSGRRLSPGVVFQGLSPETDRHLFCVSQFQVVQVRRDRVVLNVVPGREFDPEVVARMRRSLADGFAERGETVQVETRVVEELETGRTGKVQMIVSRVS